MTLLHLLFYTGLRPRHEILEHTSWRYDNSEGAWICVWRLGFGYFEESTKSLLYYCEGIVDSSG